MTGFISRCKNSDWKIVDALDNADDVCTHPEVVPPGYTLNGCYADAKCPYYEPDNVEYVKIVPTDNRFSEYSERGSKNNEMGISAVESDRGLSTKTGADSN